MKIIKMLLMVFFVVYIFGSSRANAAGIGFYGSVGGGSADWNVDSGWYSPTDFTKRTNHFGIGLVLDTAPARDNLFNYQLNVGYDRFRNKKGDAWGNAEFDGLVISNNFGFGGMITPTTRLWFGPEVRLEWADGSPDSYPNYKIHLFGAGIGPVVGVNFNIGDSHTVAVKAGYQYIHYTGKGDGYYSHTTNAPTTYSNSYDYEVTEKMFYVNLEFMFRTLGDR